MRINRKISAASTSQRRLLLRLIAQEEGHITAKELYAKALEEDPGISLATVYRALRLFTTQDVIHERAFGNSACRYYEMNRADEHHHMVCQGCGRVVEFESPLVEQIVSDVEKNRGFKVKGIDISVDGLCPDCNGRESKPGGEKAGGEEV